jgi:glycosyltransferase involved in cell wall biosynthesis
LIFYGGSFTGPSRIKAASRRNSAALASKRDLPRLTAIVPCYNYGHFLNECVESVVSQPGVDVDVIIIDDKSPDGSGDIADALAAAHHNVRSIRHDSNKGHLATYNEGLELAEGEYVVLLDADDVIAPGAFLRAIALFQANPQVGLVYGHPRNFTDVVPAQPRTQVRSWTTWPGHAWIRAQVRRGLSIVYSPEVVMRRSVLRDVGGFRAELPHAGDLDMWLRFAAISDIGRVNGPDQAFRRVHASSMMQTGYGTVLADLRGRQDAFESFFAKDAGALCDRAELVALSRQVTAVEAINFVSNRLLGGTMPAPEDASYLDFAAELSAAALQLPAATDCAWLRAHNTDRHPVARARRRKIALQRAMEGRLVWRRWYWFGY